MFGEVMRKEPIAKAFLESLLCKKIAEIRYAEKEQDISDDPESHGIRLDVYIEDKNRTRYNVEMQTSKNDDIQKRSRYYQSGIDRRFLERGAKYKELPESFVIFVCDFDFYKRGLAQYERLSVIKDAKDVAYNDGSHVIMLNTHYKKGNAPKEILEFLDYIKSKDDDFSCVSSLVQMAKDELDVVRNDKRKEERYMTWQLSIQEAEERGEKRGEKRGEQKTLAKAILAFADILTPEDIADRLNVPLKEVQRVLGNKKKN